MPALSCRFFIPGASIGICGSDLQERCPMSCDINTTTAGCGALIRNFSKGTITVTLDEAKS
jgi:hypothetical protein